MREIKINCSEVFKSLVKDYPNINICLSTWKEPNRESIIKIYNNGSFKLVCWETCSNLKLCCLFCRNKLCYYGEVNDSYSLKVLILLGNYIKDHNIS